MFKKVLIDPSTAVIISKSFMGLFVGSVTLWYLVTPYLVQPHHKFNTDYENYVSTSQTSEREHLIENWTKWKLLLGSDKKNITLDSFQSISFEDLESEKVYAAFEWRNEYKTTIYKSESSLDVVKNEPWYSKYGLYDHYYIQYSPKGGVQYLPRFMFGVPNGVLEKIYGGAENIPITGLISENPATDRMALQFLMNIVTMTVIFLLYINNPPKYNKKEI